MIAPVLYPRCYHPITCILRKGFEMLSDERCELCGMEIAHRDVRGGYVATRVQGWEVKRDAGGTNHVLARESMPGIAHVWCVKHPELANQQEMFEE